ncbi:hypothetical protein ACIQYS_14460 [Psychrobacillus sp. NPDC096426]|uniref:hypothetical protein n=1 Tax=Psychrobacillus sp. NPDC096426 TaxID=3364491 RepID=UPI0038040792
MKVKPEMFLVETEKALQIVERKVKEKMNEMTPKTQVKLLNEMLPKVQDFGQYEELLKKKQQLEFEILSSKGGQFIPDDAREKIENNRKIELAELYKVIDSKTATLKKHFDVIENEVMPLLQEINQLHQREISLGRLDRSLYGEYGYGIQDQLVLSPKISAITHPDSRRCRDLKEVLNTLLKVNKGVKLR